MQTVDERTETAAALEGIDGLVEETMRVWKIPGLAVLIIRDGEVVHAQGYGLRDVERGLPVTPETVFAIGSCSKAFTTTSLAMLADEGKLDWDTPIREYLPDFRLKDPVATDGMTALDLVTHRSGLPGHELMWYGSGLSRREIYQRLRYLEPNKGFRARFEYSNLSYMTAGVLVEALSGMSWEQFIRERIFAPLGMHDSNVSVEESKRTENHSLPYGERDGQVQAIPFRNIDAIGPAGSINSTALNMAQWVLLQLNKGKHGETQLVSEAQLAKVHSPQIVAEQPMQWEDIPFGTYGLGWAIFPYRGHRLIWHTGGIDGFISMTSFLPDRNTGLVVLSNMDMQNGPTALSYDLVDRLLGLEPRPWNERLRKTWDEMMEAAKKAAAAAPKVEGTHPSHELSAYAGEFANPAYGPLSVEVSGDGLALNFHEKQYALTHRLYDIFNWDTGFFGQILPLTFITALDGSVGSVSIPFQPGIAEIVFTRVPAEKQEGAETSG